MHGALVEHAEHQIDRHDREQQQHADAAERGLEGLRGALKPAEKRLGCAELEFRPLDSRTASPTRRARRELNEIVAEGSWPDMRNRQRPGHRVQRRDGASGTSAPRSCGRGAVQRARIRLVLRLQLHDDRILVARREDGRDLARTVRRVQRVLDLVRRHAQRGGAFAIDVDPHLRAVEREIGVHVRRTRRRAQLLDHLRHPSRSSSESASSSEYWYWLFVKRPPIRSAG